MTIVEEPQGYTQPYKRHLSAHMCTIEKTAKLCNGTLEAFSVVMAPSERSCGRGAWVSTMLGAHREKKRTCRTPLALGAGAAPSARHTPARQDADDGHARWTSALPELRPPSSGCGQ